MDMPLNIDFSLINMPQERAPETRIILDVQPLVNIICARAQYSPGMYNLLYTTQQLSAQHVVEHILAMLPYAVAGSEQTDDVMLGIIRNLAALGIDIVPIQLELVQTIDAGINFLINLYSVHDPKFLHMLVNRDLVTCDFLAGRIVRAGYS